MRIHHFTFNPFAENSYLIIGQEKNCIIVDPGMMDKEEEEQFFKYIQSEGLRPTRLVNTHCHIDHVLGVHAVCKRYGLKMEILKEDLPTWEANPKVADTYGLPYVHHSVAPTYLDPKAKIILDGEELEIRFVPGHALGHLVLVDHAGGNVIAGDTLFQGGIGRTDLPGGDHETLLRRIKSELYTLPEDYEVWPGHGPSTTIGREKASNPFVRG